MSLPNPKMLAKLRDDAILFAQKLGGTASDPSGIETLLKQQRTEERKLVGDRLAELTAARDAITARIDAEIAREKERFNKLSPKAPQKPKRVRKR